MPSKESYFTRAYKVVKKWFAQWKEFWLWIASNAIFFLFSFLVFLYLHYSSTLCDWPFKYSLFKYWLNHHVAALQQPAHHTLGTGMMELQSIGFEDSSNKTCQWWNFLNLLLFSKKDKLKCESVQCGVNDCYWDIYIKMQSWHENSIIVYLCWQGMAKKGSVGIAWQMGHKVSSVAEFEDLSFENGRRKFLMDDELSRGRSKSSISCI